MLLVNNFSMQRKLSLLFQFHVSLVLSNVHAKLVEKSLEIYFGEENKTKQFITEMISSLPQGKKKKVSGSVKDCKKNAHESIMKKRKFL